MFFESDMFPFLIRTRDEKLQEVKQTKQELFNWYSPACKQRRLFQARGARGGGVCVCAFWNDASVGVGVGVCLEDKLSPSPLRMCGGGSLRI